MSRSQLALFGIGGIIGATLLVTPLVNWTGGETPPAFANGYNPLLSEANCAEVDSQLALVSRPATDEVQEVAFLAGLAPAGGDGFTVTAGELDDIPGVILLPGGTILPDGTVLPGGAQLPDKTTIAAGPLPNGTLLPSGTILPGGAELPDGQKLAPDTELPGGGPPPEQIAELTPEELTPPECKGTECEEVLQNTGPCTGENCEQTLLNDDQRGAAVPEPASLGVLALGVGLLATRRRRSA